MTLSHLDIFPYLQLEIYSLDKWDRHCTEGYAIVNIPPTPGNSML